MVTAKSKNVVGLGNSLMNDRFGKGKGADRKKITAPSIHRINHATGEMYVTNEREEASWVKLRSVTEQPALDEFLSTAELADVDFTAKKMSNIKIIKNNERNPYLLSTSEEQIIIGKQAEFKDRLTIPRRPEWDSSTTPEKLDSLERSSFLSWRRGLAELQQNQDLLLTPFERNLEVWRQLWRVIERSNLVVQIVDARNPLLFRSEDLEKYVINIDAMKKNLLLVNKADLLTLKQRQAWANFFRSAKIQFKFFSARLAKESNEEHDYKLKGKIMFESVDESNRIIEDDDIRILNVLELESLFLRLASINSASESINSGKIQIGLVGYPNVGKSSTINALIKAKKVPVSSTPGKTKHFQTIHLSDKVILCDCPGLVFPNFAKTKAELVCNGILPIDQLREVTGPVSIVTQHIPKSILESIYGIKIVTKPLEEGGTCVPTAEELLTVYAKSRGFTRSKQGQPDESRAARYILKDYVNGKLLFCHPPSDEIDPMEFNMEHYNRDSIFEKSHLEVGSLKRVDFVNGETSSFEKSNSIVPKNGFKSQRLDNDFFSPRQKNAVHLQMPFNYKYSQQGGAGGNLLSQGKKNKLLLDANSNMNNSLILISKKHFKGGKKGNKKRELS